MSGAGAPGVGASEQGRCVGVCLSGGGHRATAWAAGTLGAVVAAGLHRDTVSITSVSGGSITSGAVAVAGDFRDVDSVETLADWLAPTMRVVAVDGLFLPGRPTRRYVRLTLTALVVWACTALALLTALGAIARREPWWPYALAGGASGIAAGWMTSRLITHRLAASLVVGTVLGAVVSSVAAVAVRDLDGWRRPVVVGLLVVVVVASGELALIALARRSGAVADALSQQFARVGEPDRRLRDVVSKVDHVFCTTDLEWGHALFFTPAFAYGYGRGLADLRSSDLTVAQVVQASAAVPPGFPPVPLDLPGFERRDGHGAATRSDPGRVFLSDGGVYDNLGDEWEAGFAARASLYREIGDVQEPADLLVVSDASPRLGWRPFEARGPLRPEVAGLLRNLDVQWANTTTRRRRDLYEQFRGAPHDRQSGVLVMIDDSPLDVCRAVVEHADPVIAGRARRAVGFLESQRSEDEWRRLSSSCSKVPTTLGPLTIPVTLELIELSFVSTMVALHVFCGVGDLQRCPIETFAGRLGGAAVAQTDHLG